MFKKDQIVKVYDGDLVGFTTARLINKYGVVEEEVLERWAMETEQGAILIRYVKNHSDAMRDGCGYIIKD